MRLVGAERGVAIFAPTGGGGSAGRPQYFVKAAPNRYVPLVGPTGRRP
jgi:hypothetical protein